MTARKCSKSFWGINFQSYSYFLLLEQSFHYNFEIKMTARSVANHFIGEFCIFEMLRHENGRSTRKIRESIHSEALLVVERQFKTRIAKVVLGEE